jgi:L-lysine 2,3-aminomutase
MITHTRSVPERSPWQEALADAISDPGELLRDLCLSPAALGSSEAALRQFSLRVPRGFAARMHKGDARDPLLRQVLPVGAETDAVPGFRTDPVGDLTAEVVPGVLHKYHGRVLLVLTGACAIHCRYCFRRHFPYGRSSPARDHFESALGYLRDHPAITEVILSGGDPLSLPDAHLADLAARLATIPHLRRLRVHSRLPIVLPERVDEALLSWLTGTRLSPVMVVHANHAREIDACVARALARLRRAGVTVLNQSVLLAGVNDELDVLVALSERLFEVGALPYYLHLLDPVAGAAHFDVDPHRARRLFEGLSRALPGYLVPKLVWERPGAPYKVPVELLSP